MRTAVPADELAVVCRVGPYLVALPLGHVEETLRPLPTESFANSPIYVRGLARIRGAVTPVVDAAALLGIAESVPTRYVTLKTGERRVALAVDAVVGTRAIPATSLQSMPPLLTEARGDLVSQIGSLDRQLLIVLNDAHLLPPALWAALEAGTSARDDI
jgi:purine-binding chemotaxis protein CheW